MKRRIFNIISIILLLSMVLSLVGCSNSKGEVEELILTFETACNSLDFSTVINCIKPETAEKIKLATGLIGLFTNTSKEELFEGLAKWILNDYDVGADFFASIDIDIQNIYVRGDKAEADAILRFNMAGYDIEKEATLKCIRHMRKWYISDLEIY